MILINLLPHREARRRQRKQNFFVALGVAAVAGVVVVGAWTSVLQQMKAAQQQRNDLLKAEIRKLDTQIKDIATLRAEIQALKDRQAAVEDLQTDRNTPVHLLDELVKQAPEGIYLSSIRQNGNQVTIVGTAQTNERVSEFLRNTLYSSPWLEKPELVEIKAAGLTGRERNARERDPDQRRLFDFTLRLSIKRPEAPEPAKPAPGARPAAAKAS
ncbi:PilN domain-containing protein [Rubrivivax albus]|uniref:Fimbrial assembly protein n=1 Tax=Rubrivivax albus TaxID=2499835 RepID=A0A3S2WWI5_9BURK|nr:PilN domain-containing protein [Rubrivivax albus]RVT53418.1 fimbrial assembly protein [Rubrivivax albus]